MLKVSENGHYIIKNDGTPFLWVGDTCWKLNRGSCSEIQAYLDDRQNKGFSVIQVFAAISMWSPSTDYHGNLPFVNGDPRVLNGEYWDRWRNIADECERRGLYLALHLGEPIRLDSLWPATTASMAYEYGRQIGHTFKDKQNIIYNLGLDTDPDHLAREADFYRAMAEGIADGINNVNDFNGSADFSRTFMTFHPQGCQRSATWFAGDDWLNAEGNEPGGTYGLARTYAYTNADYNMPNPKPSINVEGNYEGMDYEDGHGVTTRLDLVRQAYQTYFAGGFYSFGNKDITCNADPIWSLSTEGAGDLARLAGFLRNNVKWWKLIPDQSLIASGASGQELIKVAAKSSDGDEAFVFFAENNAAAVHMSSITASINVSAKWFDPYTGNTRDAANYSNSSIVLLTPPDGWSTALLVLRAH